MKKIAVLAMLAAAGAAQGATAYDAAYIIYDGGYGAPVFYHNSTVVANSGPVNTFYNPAGAFAASVASGDTYNSVYVYDITSFPMYAGSDLAAIGAWYSTSKSVVIDGRSYGDYFTGTGGAGDGGAAGGNAEDDFAQNIAKFFSANGGGLWVGADHDPDWTYNANPVLSACGFIPIIGLESGPATGTLPSPLYAGVTTAGLDWSGGGGGWSVGHTPVGLQPNGVVLSNILYSGVADPMISVNLVPAPASLAVLGLFGLGRRRR